MYDYASIVFPELVALHQIIILVGSTSTCSYNGIFRLINDLYAININAELFKFFRKVYLKDLKLNGEYLKFLYLQAVIKYLETF